jgi:uncharacterized protein (TIGR03067 family)
LSFLPSLCWVVLAAPMTTPGTTEIDRLVRHLGSPQFDEREAAVARLEAIGEPALEALRKAAGSDDVEVRRRARALVEAIEGRDYQRLEGTWECVPDGSPRLVVSTGAQALFERGTRVTMTFTLSPTQTPKEIDFHHRGRPVLLGLYALKGDDLHLCLPVRNDLQRPRALAAAGDTGSVTLTFKRVKSAPEPKSPGP